MEAVVSLVKALRDVFRLPSGCLLRDGFQEQFFPRLWSGVSNKPHRRLVFSVCFGLFNDCFTQWL